MRAFAPPSYPVFSDCGGFYEPEYFTENAEAEPVRAARARCIRRRPSIRARFRSPNSDGCSIRRRGARGRLTQMREHPDAATYIGSAS